MKTLEDKFDEISIGESVSIYIKEPAYILEKDEKSITFVLSNQNKYKLYKDSDLFLFD